MSNESYYAQQNRTPAVPGRSPKLLIVDDQKGMTKVISMAAAELGYETMEVNDSSQATEAFIEFRPDVLVLDLIMPGKDGVDVLNEVLVVDPTVKLVLISGHGDSYLKLGSAVSDFHREGATVEILHKPFRANALRGVLRDLATA